MFPTSIKHALENIGSLYKNWRAAGSGCIAASFNIVCLGLLWLMAPLESEPLASLRRNKAFFYPQVDFNAPKLFDQIGRASSRRSFSWQSCRRVVTARVSCAWLLTSCAPQAP